MKNTFLNVLLMCIFFCMPAMADSPPKPISGTPFITSKSFSVTSGNFVFDFKFPPEWGMGDMEVEEGAGHFHLFPEGGGIGCHVEINKFDDSASAQAAFKNLYASFKSTTKNNNEFEAEFSKAFYICRLQDEHLIQIWYSLPKKKKGYATQWQSLKNCVSISRRTIYNDPKPILPPVVNHPSPVVDKSSVDQEVPQEFIPLKEVPRKGWIYAHREKPLEILFESFIFLECHENKDPSTNYLLSFEGFTSSGFFYVKWDQDALDTQAPYEQHLQEMMNDVVSIETSQTFSEPLKFDSNEKYAILRGDPYVLITLAGDDFLFGFALKNDSRFIDLNINDYVKRVKWSTPKN